jgi:hypothetical protein
MCFIALFHITLDIHFIISFFRFIILCTAAGLPHRKDTKREWNSHWWSKVQIINQPTACAAHTQVCYWIPPQRKETKHDGRVPGETYRGTIIFLR